VTLAPLFRFGLLAVALPPFDDRRLDTNIANSSMNRTAATTHELAIMSALLPDASVAGA
jgi:hypothetical protein